jgi:hypothetical protein
MRTALHEVVIRGAAYCTRGRSLARSHWPASPCRPSAVVMIVPSQQEYTRAMPKRLIVAVSRNGILLMKIPENFTEGTMVQRAAVHPLLPCWVAPVPWPSVGMLAGVQEIMVRYPLSDVFRWAYKPSVNFYFEVKNEASDAENFVFTFLTQEVCGCVCLWLCVPVPVPVCVCVCVCVRVGVDVCVLGRWGLLVLPTELSLLPVVSQGVHISDLLTDYAMALLREMGLNPDGTQRAPRVLPSAATSGSAAGTGLYTNVSTPSAAAAAAAAAPAYTAPAPAPAPVPAPAPAPVPEPIPEPEPVAPQVCLSVLFLLLSVCFVFVVVCLSVCL